MVKKSTTTAAKSRPPKKAETGKPRKRKSLTTVEPPQGPQTAPGIAGIRSFRKRLWRVPEVTSSDVKAMIMAGIPEGVAPILVARGLQTRDAADYVTPTLRNLLPDPMTFKDMDRAVERIFKAIEKKEKMAVWGDYDVDGATSTALLIRFLRAVGHDATIYIPDRIAEGYGLNEDGLIKLAAQDIKLVVAVDAGTTAFTPIAAADKAGLDVVVIDHHSPEDKLPKQATAIVNPNRLDQEPGYGHLCAAGITFITIIGLNARMRDGGYYKTAGIKQPDLMQMLDLVALGTVADVVPLIGLNRAFVRQGLKILTKRENMGLKTLAEVADLKGEVRSHHCGFVLGPRINAGGRLGDSSAGARLLVSDDPIECLDISQRLNALNKERQDIERKCTEVAQQQADAQNLTNAILFASGEGWHEGVVGIVASRVKEAFDKPAFIFSITDGVAKGSGRSMEGFHLGDAIHAALHEGILIKGGGHAMAGGVTLDAKRLDEFQAFLNERVAASDFGRNGVIVGVDAEIGPEQVTTGLADALASMEPYGQGNSKARFIIRNASIMTVKLLKEAHIRLDIMTSSGNKLSAIAFNIAGTPLAEGLLASSGTVRDIMGTIKADEWLGFRKAQIEIEDARIPATPVAYGEMAA